jgi:hypothetical protein
LVFHDGHLAEYARSENAWQNSRGAQLSDGTRKICAEIYQRVEAAVQKSTRRHMAV